MVRGITFVADYDYEAQNQGEVSFVVGDVIRIYQSEGDWWYGELARTGEVGWVPPTYGHARQEVSPYADRDSKTNLAERKIIFDQLISSQAHFIAGLRSFIDNVVAPLSLKDTAFKRSFLGDSAVAVSFNLLQEMLNACSNFDLTLRGSKGNIEVANAFSQFAPSLQIFAQYTSENTRLLNAVATNAKALDQFVATGDHIEGTLLSPLQFFPAYKTQFQEYVWLTPDDSSNKEGEALFSALDLIISQTDYVDAKLKEEAQSLQLLNLQTKFTGHPIIYTPSRKLIQEGEMERLRMVDNEVVAKQYYVFLFNDAFIYCQRNMMGRYKLQKAFDLKDCKIEMSDMGGDTAKIRTFTIVTKENAEKPDVFRIATGDDDAAEWMRLLKSQLAATKTRKMDKRGSVIARTTVNIPGVEVSQLEPRCAALYRFLTQEMMFAEAMTMLNITLVQPLIDASKGAVLSACKVTSSTISGGDGGYSLKEGQSKNKDALFNQQGSMSQSQAKQITEALADADVQIFLRAAEGLSQSIGEFNESLEALCNAAKWKDTINAGSYFNSQSALAMYNQFKSYANGQQAALRVLRTTPFQQFYKDAEQYLSSIPGTLEAKIELPRNRVKRILLFVKELESVTPSGHGDIVAVKASVDALEYMDKDIEEVIRAKRNFETLLDIQNSLVSFSIMGSDPILQKLASMDRTFLRVGDLKKVCRKANKTFRFWLFNDLLIYGNSLGAGKYSFNRSLDLTKCSVAPHQSSSVKNAFQIIGAEKSFVVIAPSAGNLQEWLESITAAKKALIAANPHLAQDAVTESAPIWAADKDSDSCSICSKGFTMFKRRHHCRKCGAVVCGDHSKNSIILPHLHKTSKQRVCDNCFNNPNAPTTATAAHSPALAVAAADPAPTATRASAAAVNDPAPAPAAAPIAASKPEPAPAPAVAVVNSTAPEVIPEPKKLNVSKVWAPTPAPVPVTEVDKPEPKKLNVSKAWAPSPSSDKVEASPPPAVPRSVSPEPAATPEVPQSIPPPLPTSAAPPVPKTAAPAGPVTEKSTSSMFGARSRRGAPAPPPIPVTPAPALNTATASAPPPVPKAPATVTAAPPPIPQVPVPAAVSTAPPPVPVALAPAAPVSPSATLVPTAPPPPSTRRAAAAAAAPPPPPPPPSSANSRPPPPKTGGTPPPPPPPPAPVASIGGGSDGADDPLKKFRKMREMLPEGAVRQKMMSEGFSPAEIDSFFGAGGSGGGGATPPPPPGPPRGTGAPPPPPAAPPASAVADPNDPMFKFRKMKEMLPEGAVRQKMTTEGFSATDIDDFFAGRPVKSASAAAAPTRSAPSGGGGGGGGGGGFLAALSSPPKLKAAPTAEQMAASKPAKKPSLLDEINKGAKLKSVAKDDVRMKQPPAVQGAGGLLGMLADQMSKRRFNMKVEDEDSDSDDGFSDSDDD